MCELDLVGIHVRDREPLQRAVGLEHVDRAPVGELGHRQGGHVRERPLVLEGRGEKFARLPDELLILCQAALSLVELGGADGGGGDVREEGGGALLLLAEGVRFAVVEDERADDAIGVAEAADEHRARAGRFVGLAVRSADPIGGRDVLRDERLLEQDGIALAADRSGCVQHVRLRQPVVGGDAPGAVGGIPAPERVGVGCERAARQLEDLRQHRLDAKRAEQGGRGFEEQAEPLDLIAEEAVVLYCSMFDILSRHKSPCKSGELSDFTPLTPNFLTLRRRSVARLRDRSGR